jgi:hypothetical protein
MRSIMIVALAVVAGSAAAEEVRIATSGDTNETNSAASLALDIATQSGTQSYAFGNTVFGNDLLTSSTGAGLSVTDASLLLNNVQQLPQGSFAADVTGHIIANPLMGYPYAFDLDLKFANVDLTIISSAALQQTIGGLSADPLAYLLTEISFNPSLTFVSYNGSPSFTFDDVLAADVIAPANVPEPGMLALLAAGLVGIALRSRSLRASSAAFAWRPTGAQPSRLK